VIPVGWSYDQFGWSHLTCICMGAWGEGIGEEQRSRRGYLMAVLCLDCGECFDIARVPASVAA
jgi:hypothetical protein